MTALSIIVPVLDEATGIDACLRALAPLRQRGVEVIVVDGGSADATVTLAGPLADRVLDASRGRASQMNAGAREARGAALLFLHADTRLPPEADRLVLAALSKAAWGRFDVRIDGVSAGLRIVAAFMNARSRLTGIATGDQAIFVRRAVFEGLGGFPEMDLMEDVTLSQRLRAVSSPACLRERVSTSGRRWDRHGILRTAVLMWRLRFAYWRGADPSDLARRYGTHPTSR